MHQGLTARGGEVLDFQKAHVKEHGIPAGVTFLSRELELGRQQVGVLCKQLVDRGYMEQRPGSSLYWPVEASDEAEQ